MANEFSGPGPDNASKRPERRQTQHDSSFAFAANDNVRITFGCSPKYLVVGTKRLD
jgi:hypothetical protein